MKIRYLVLNQNDIKYLDSVISGTLSQIGFNGTININLNDLNINRIYESEHGTIYANLGQSNTKIDANKNVSTTIKHDGTLCYLSMKNRMVRKVDSHIEKIPYVNLIKHNS